MKPLITAELYAIQAIERKDLLRGLDRKTRKVIKKSLAQAFKHGFKHGKIASILEPKK